MAGTHGVALTEARVDGEAGEVRIAGRLRRAFVNRGVWFAEVEITPGRWGAEGRITVPLRNFRIRVRAGSRPLPPTAGGV